MENPVDFSRIGPITLAFWRPPVNSQLIQVSSWSGKASNTNRACKSNCSTHQKSSMQHAPKTGKQHVQGGPKQVSPDTTQITNCIRLLKKATSMSQIWMQKSTQTRQVEGQYSMHGPISDIISYCDSSCDMDSTGVNDKILIENRKRKGRLKELKETTF